MPETTIDLAPYMAAISDCDYALIKLAAHFPRLNVGEDLDIVAVDKESLVQRLLTAAKGDLEAGIVVRVTYGPERSYIHVDLLKDDVLNVRFDVASRLASFGAYRVKESYTDKMLEAATRRQVAIGAETVSVSVVGELDELVVRYLEYHELFATRPDKVKHLDYVMEALESAPQRRAFLDRLHENIELPKPPKPVPERKRTSLAQAVSPAIQTGRELLPQLRGRGLRRRAKARLARLRR